MIRSILNDVLDKIKNEKDISKIKEIVKDKVNMIKIINGKKDYFSLVKAVYDLLLKYEGDGVINESLNGYKLRKRR